MGKIIPKLSPAFVTRNGKTEAVIISKRAYERILQILEDYKDVIDMLEAERAPEEEAVNYEQYRKKRLKNV